MQVVTCTIIISALIIKEDVWKYYSLILVNMVNDLQ
jgi:hypothetical protein